MRTIQAHLRISLDDVLHLGITLDDGAISAIAEVVRQVWALQPQSKEEARRRQSQHANLAGQKPPDDFELLIGSREAAKLLGISARTLWGLQNSGDMPAPVRIGRLVRWNRDQLKAWVDAGCPKGKTLNED